METDAYTSVEGHTSMERKFNDSPRGVSPSKSGKGWPYAPVDWPNPGDIWGWRVGKRFSKQGIFRDRYLRVPRRLQMRPTRALEFQSKPAVERYLRSTFPEADVDAFFESFTWIIRVKPEFILKGKSVDCPQLCHTPIHKHKEKGGRGVFKRTWKAALMLKDEISSGDGFLNLSINIAPREEETLAASSKRLSSTSSLGRRVSNEFTVCQNDSLDSPTDCKVQTNPPFKKSQADPVPEEFNRYLSSLDEGLDTPLLMHQSSPNKETMTDVRKKLSSLLAMGISCLLASSKVNELIAFTYKLQNDPDLSLEELSMLKLIQSIPFTSKSFLEAKELSSKADEFFGGLNAKIASVASLKEEYDTLKEEMEAVHADEASALLDILDIDQEISNLQKRRQAKAETIKVTSKKLIHLTSTEERVMYSLPMLVREVQMAKSEKSTWEFKKKKAVEEEAEILARFAPLEGFSF